MKRLKMPNIPTRIPVPDMPSIRRRSHKKANDASVSGDVPPVAAEPSQEAQPVEQPVIEQTAEAKETGHRKVNIPKIPLPSISKPSLRKPSVPKIPLPSISKPSAPRLSVPKIPLPGISLPSRSKKASTQEETIQPEIEAAPASQLEESSAKQDKPKAKGISGLHMPSFRKSKQKSEAVEQAAPAPYQPETAAAVESVPAQAEEKHETVEQTAPTLQMEEPYVPLGQPSAMIEQPSATIETPKAKAGISGIHMPAMPSFRKTKGQSATTEEAAPAPQLEEQSALPETPKSKGKSKISMPRMPKIGLPSMSAGKGGAKTTGKRILALSIEGNDIRLLTYHNNAVESWKSVPFDASLLKMGQVADPVGLGEVIKGAVAGIEPGRCHVLCALPGLRSVSRIIAVPNVSKKEMDAVVPREVRRTMTVSEEDNYFHWQVLPVEAAQARVFVLAVPKEPLSLLLQAFSNAGLHPAAVELKPLALMRALNQKDAIIANCEGNSMELVIVSNDIPVLIRSVFLGEGVANQDYTVGRISDELGRTIVTYNEINKESPLDQDTPVYLTGAAAAGVPFALNVAALTGRTVQPLESPVTIPDDLPLAEYMVNIGLILKVV